ncbi:hypothetical protein [Burkholderia phage BCSR5]|nr:hypothetical protein [Burkholderia phage BCSR5]
MNIIRIDGRIDYENTTAWYISAIIVHFQPGKNEHESQFLGGFFVKAETEYHAVGQLTKDSILPVAPTCACHDMEIQVGAIDPEMIEKVPEAFWNKCLTKDEIEAVNARLGGQLQ